MYKNSTKRPNLVNAASTTHHPPGHTPYSSPKVILLGWIPDPDRFHKYKEAYGRIVEVEREKKRPCKGPCWRWCGPFNRGLPVIKSQLSTYSVRKLILNSMGYEGKIGSACGHPDCVRPGHHRVASWSKYMAYIRPATRDSATGRYLKEDS